MTKKKVIYLYRVTSPDLRNQDVKASSRLGSFPSPVNTSGLLILVLILMFQQNGSHNFCLFSWVLRTMGKKLISQKQQYISSCILFGLSPIPIPELIAVTREKQFKDWLRPGSRATLGIWVRNESHGKHMAKRGERLFLRGKQGSSYGKEGK